MCLCFVWALIFFLTVSIFRITIALIGEMSEKSVIVFQIIRRGIFFFFCHSFVWLNKFIDVDCLLWYSKYSAAQSTFDAIATTKKVYIVEMLYQHRLYTIRAKISTNWKFSQWIYKSSYCVRRLCMDWWYWLVGWLSFFSISCGFGIKIVI